MSTDLRKYAKQTTTRLVIGGTLVIFIIGISLIGIIYGLPAALSGFLCLLGGISPIALILAGFWAMELIVKKYRENEIE